MNQYHTILVKSRIPYKKSKNTYSEKLNVSAIVEVVVQLKVIVLAKIPRKVDHIGKLLECLVGLKTRSHSFFFPYSELHHGG